MKNSFRVGERNVYKMQKEREECVWSTERLLRGKIRY